MSHDLLYCFFFFSSRRRHTRLQGDWSSDVCSSDLRRADEGQLAELMRTIVALNRRIAELAPATEALAGVEREAAALSERLEVAEQAAEEQWAARSEEHTSELQSPCNLVCRLLLEKKKKKKL